MKAIVKKSSGKVELTVTGSLRKFSNAEAREWCGAIEGDWANPDYDDCEFKAISVKGGKLIRKFQQLNLSERENADGLLTPKADRLYDQIVDETGIELPLK